MKANFMKANCLIVAVGAITWSGAMFPSHAAVEFVSSVGNVTLKSTDALGFFADSGATDTDGDVSLSRRLARHRTGKIKGNRPLFKGTEEPGQIDHDGPPYVGSAHSSRL